MKGSIFITLFFCFFVIDTNFAQELQGDIALSFKSGKYQSFALLRGEIRESSSSIRFGGGADRKIISAVQAGGQSFLSPNPKEVAPYFASKTNKGVYLYFDKDKKCIYHFEYYPGRIKVRRIYSQKGNISEADFNEPELDVFYETIKGGKSKSRSIVERRANGTSSRVAKKAKEEQMLEAYTGKLDELAIKYAPREHTPETYPITRAQYLRAYGKTNIVATPYDFDFDIMAFSTSPTSNKHLMIAGNYIEYLERQKKIPSPTQILRT